VCVPVNAEVGSGSMTCIPDNFFAEGRTCMKGRIGRLMKECVGEWVGGWV